MARVLIVPDLQIPFEHKDALAFVRAVARKYKPNYFINIGDELDNCATSDYDHDPDGMSAGDEFKVAIARMKYWYKAFPKTFVCISNHGARPYRKAHKHGISKHFMKDYHDFMEAPPGWVWADNFEIDGVIYQHGEGYSGQMGALKAAHTNMQSTVIGHLHSWAGIQYSANNKHLIFGFNVGCLIDRHAYAFAYGKHLPNKPILGCGLVIDGVPLFVPMELDGKGRWTGRI